MECLGQCILMTLTRSTFLPMDPLRGMANRDGLRDSGQSWSTATVNACKPCPSPPTNGIHQLEILPVTMACIAFEEQVCRPVYFHVDNTAAQSALINAGSSNHSSRSLVYLYLDLEQRLQLRPWISRIGSVSNIADGPSRGWFGEVEGLGAKCFEFPEKVLFYVLEDFKKKRGSLAMSNA